MAKPLSRAQISTIRTFGYGTKGRRSVDNRTLRALAELGLVYWFKGYEGTVRMWSLTADGIAEKKRLNESQAEVNS